MYLVAGTPLLGHHLLIGSKTLQTSFNTAVKRVAALPEGQREAGTAAEAVLLKEDEAERGEVVKLLQLGVRRDEMRPTLVATIKWRQVRIGGRPSGSCVNMQHVKPL